MTYLKYSLFMGLMVLLSSCHALKLTKISTNSITPQLISVLGGGGNTAVLFSKDKKDVLIVDTKNGRGAKKLKKMIDSKAPNAHITIINTHFHYDHIGGNKLYYKEGNVVKHIIGNYTSNQWQKQTNQMFRGTAQIISSQAHIQFRFGGENVHIFSVGQGHTWSDLIVYFEQSKTLMTGDLVFNEFHPVIDVKAGANIDEWINALDDILIKFEDVNIIPGHGEMTDISSVKFQRQYLIDLRDVREGNADWKSFSKKYKDLHSLPFYSGLNCSKKVTR